MAERHDVRALFSPGRCVTVCAPMVRYSRLPFRELVRLYDCDLCFTPMIMADSFVRSESARQSEFSSSALDRPLVAQFACCSPGELLAAARLVLPHCDGVDLNCGCPQRWALQQGVGARLLSRPELLADLVKQLRGQLPAHFSVSAKIRLLPDRRRSVELCRRLQSCGVDFVSVHCRTPQERRQPADHESLGLLTSACPGLPILANGDVGSLREARRLCEAWGCAGAMSARGILRNPALFRGDAATPDSCVRDWLRLSCEAGCSYATLQHHLELMLETRLQPAQRRLLHSLHSLPALLHFVDTLMGD